MVSNELFDWLTVLKPEEHETFVRFLQISNHQPRKLPCRLYAWLMANPSLWKNQGGWESKRKLHLDLHEVLFHGKDFKPQRIRRVFMDLRLILEEFIGLQVMQRPDVKVEKEIKLLHYLQERGASRLFNRRLEELEFFLSQKARISPDNYLAQMGVHQLRNEYFIHNNVPDDTFDAANEALAKSFLIRSLQNFTAMRAREVFHPKSHQYHFESEINAMAETPIMRSDSLVCLWKSIYLMVSPGANRQHYEEASISIRALKDRLPLITVRQVRGHMFNYLLRSQELGSRDYYHRLWELLCAMLEEGTLHMPDGRMTFPFFIATVRAACLCGQQDWAASFIALHAEDLVGAGKEEQIQYCALLVDFHAGRLQETWYALLTFCPQDLRIETYARTLQVQIAYDLGKEDEFVRQVDALGKFIARNEALGARFVALVQEFARFAARLGHVRFISHKLPKGLAARLEAKDTTEKIWLGEKVSALAKP